MKLLYSLSFLFTLFAEPFSQEIYDKLFPETIEKEDKFFTTTTLTQLGNACFMAAAGIGYALENGYYFALDPVVKNRYPIVFDRFPLYEVEKPSYELHHATDRFYYKPIEESTNIVGWCNSDFYFAKYKEIIREMFKPSNEMVNTLKRKYSEYFQEDKNYVGIHLRTFVTPNEEGIYPFEYFIRWGLSPQYYSKAMGLFSKDSIFVVISDNPKVAKKFFSRFSGNFIFHDSDNLYEDFYLISMMKSMIIPNSSFSAFACCLNANPNKTVVKPPNGESVAIFDESWTLLNDQFNFRAINRWYLIYKNEFNLMRANQKDHKSH